MVRKRIYSTFMEMLATELRILADFGLFLVIWMVQLIIYPGFLYCERDLLLKWHSRYTGLISLFVVPLMFTQLAVVGYQTFIDPVNINIASLVLVVIAWIFTFTLSVPAHNRIKTGMDPDESIKWLINSNWLRTVCWSAVLSLGIAGSVLTR